MRGLTLLLGLMASILFVFLPFATAPARAARSLSHHPTPAIDSLAQYDRTPEQQFADRYAPVVYLRQGSTDICSEDYEGFDPVPVDFVLGQSNIPLMVSDDGAPSGKWSILAESPTAADLYGRDQSTFLNYPGSPTAPRCTYRQDFQSRMNDVPHVAYAHIYQQPGTTQLALQYWMFYYLNDWNNTHEGDWEMIMLLFNATTVEEALGQEPAKVIYSQHGGGEQADWSDKKLSKEDGHPVIYVARGAHASEYQPRIYLGLAEHGTGFGCENADGPHRRLALSAIVVPHVPAGPNDEFAWLGFNGHWGELKKSEWNGPTGPNTKSSWDEPVTWASEVRDTSLTVPEFQGFGEAPVSLFCGIVSGGSSLLVGFSVAPALTVGFIGAVLASIAWIISAAMGTVRQTYRVYRAHMLTFGLIGSLLIPVGFIVATLQTILFLLPTTDAFLTLMDRFPAVRILLALTIGSVQVALAVIFVAPSVTFAMGMIQEGRTPGVIESYRFGVRATWLIIVARFRIAVRVFLEAITIIGIPRAIRRLIGGYFVGQAVILLGDTPTHAIEDSVTVAKRDRRRTLLTSVVLNIIVLLTGPIVAIFLLLAIPSRPIGLINYVSSVLFALLYPASVIGMTLLYHDLRFEHETEDVETVETPASQSPGSTLRTSH